MYHEGVNETLPLSDHGREPAPTPALQLVQAFVNTNDIEDDRDALRTPDQLRDWLQARDRLAADETVTPEAHRRTLAIREGPVAHRCERPRTTAAAMR